MKLTGAMLNGWQEVIITAGVPLDMLFIYCNKKLEVQTDTAAVLSVCPPQVIKIITTAYVMLK